MKKVVFCMAASAMIAACGQQADKADDDAPGGPVVVAAPDTAQDYLGAWSVSYPDGTKGVTTNNEDGTYVAEMEDGTSITGTWTFGEEQSCWTPDEGENGGCYAISPAEFDGSRVLTGEDGKLLIVAPVRETAEAPATEAS